ncbi:MAG TPA: DUF58 domain-containing protein [Treponema sp.]|nr:DUF58 domain-containing protein [Treponema sp.]
MKQHFLAVNRESLAKQASLLRIASVKLADSLRAGTFRSLYRGQGIEFSGVREYLRGDDVRAIDWNVTARMGKPFVKLFEEEHELQIFLVIDRSFSMFTGSGKRSRYETAAEAAALITMAAEVNASSVGAVIFDGEIRFSCSPESGRRRTMLLLTRLDETDGSESAGSVLGSALTGAGKLLKKRSLVFVLSDFRSTSWIDPLASLAQKHDVAAVRITDASDNELPEMGTVPFIDSETKTRLVLPTSLSSFRNAWRADNRQHLAGWRESCRKHGVLPLIIATDDDPVRVLSNFFAHRGQTA